MGFDADNAVRAERHVDATVEAVWSVLADGWAYATWVVGASRIRAVDEGWPGKGTRIHHSVGLWPLLINDTTEVLSVREPTELVLKARGWPLGEAMILLDVQADSGETCTVSMVEDAVSGPMKVAPMAVRQGLILPRNREALNRLAYLAEGRHRQPLSRPE